MPQASGTFDVKVAPAEPTGWEQAHGIARYTLEKTLRGGFEGTGAGEMISAGNPATGAMMYVAVDRFTGTLDGRQGGFALLHRATMIQGDAASAEMSVVIAAGSGTEALAGIAGTLTIARDAAGGHAYTLDYTLP